MRKSYFNIIERMAGRQLFAEPGQATEFAIGLKLFSEVMLQNRELPLAGPRSASL